MAETLEINQANDKNARENSSCRIRCIDAGQLVRN
jgi:hypothetical protein